MGARLGMVDRLGRPLAWDLALEQPLSRSPSLTDGGPHSLQAPQQVGEWAGPQRGQRAVECVGVQIVFIASDAPRGMGNVSGRRTTGTELSASCGERAEGAHVGLLMSLCAICGCRLHLWPPLGRDYAPDCDYSTSGQDDNLVLHSACERHRRGWLTQGRVQRPRGPSRRRGCRPSERNRTAPRPCAQGLRPPPGRAATSVYFERRPPPDLRRAQLRTRPPMPLWEQRHASRLVEQIAGRPRAGGMSWLMLLGRCWGSALGASARAQAARAVSGVGR